MGLDIHAIILQLIQVSLPKDNRHREEHIRNLTPINGVSKGPTQQGEPEFTFLVGKVTPKDSKFSIDDLMTPITSEVLYPYYTKMQRGEFTMRFNKTLYGYIASKLEESRSQNVPDEDNVWMQPNAAFVNWFHEKGVDIDSVSPLLQNTEAKEVVNDSIDNKAEHQVAVKIIKKQRKEIKVLKLHKHKPTQMEMKEIIDRCRFKNDKCNDTKVGEALGIHPDTAKAWIKQLGLSDYAWNPKHLK